MKTGIIFNPGAGGIKKFSALSDILNKILANHVLVCGSGRYGGDYMNNCVEYNPPKGSDFSAAMRYIFSAFLKENIDLLICIGGDGLAAFAASLMINAKQCIPIMGIAGGTQNIGPLIRFNEKSLSLFNINEFKTDKVNCIKVSSQDRILGYSFCDIVLGNTYLGTLNGRVCNLSAEAFIKSNEKLQKKPSGHIAYKNFTITINGSKQKIKSNTIKQVIVSPIYKPEFYIGKAMTGALCFSKYLNKSANICISDTVIIDAEHSNLKDSILTEQIIFGDKDICEISGISKNTYVIIDGNVHEFTESIQLEYMPHLITSVIDDTKNILPVGWM